MTQPQLAHEPERSRSATHEDVALIDLLDRLLGGGVVLAGDITLAVADIDLVYVGLRALATDNLMDVLLRLVRGESAAKPRWRRGGVRWTADGRVELNPPG